MTTLTQPKYKIICRNCKSVFWIIKDNKFQSFYKQNLNLKCPYCSKTSIIGGTITTVSMSVNDTTGSNSIAFTFPFFGGFDGIDPTKRKYTGKDITSTNLFGLDCSGPTKEGVVAYRAALDIISNPDEYDINMLITPGVLHGTHGSITDYAMNVCEERQDCFYLMDNGLCTDSIATVVENVQSMNSNYVGCYYPWVKILDPLTNRYLWVSPSVVMAGVIAFNDKVAAEWYRDLNSVC